QDGFAFDNFAMGSAPAFDPFADTLTICDTVFTGDPGVWGSYQWSNGGNAQASTIVTPGLHWVRVTDSMGLCAIDTFYVNFLPAVPPNLAVTETVCEGDTTTINAGNDLLTTYTYLWSTGDTTQTIPGFDAGTYTVIKTDSTGNCVMTDSIYIHVPDIANLGNDVYLCPGDSIILNSEVGDASYIWATGQTTQTINVWETGAYAVTVIDSNGCLTLDAVAVTVTTPEVNLGPDDMMCDNHVYTIDAGTGNSFLWSDGSTNQTLVIDGATFGAGTFIFSVEVYDTNGCYANDTITITIDPCTGLNEELNNYLINVFPNPSSGIVNINVSGSADDQINVSVMDPQGKLVLTQQVQVGSNQLDLSNFERGVYIIQFESNNSTKVERLILH
ncbi:MAG: T9SS type A sorting domain-containing protein, partial [Flavobacteriales bacterium]|nr:T9SS type A sorting domain-containing protein [Flavobacteriales bacterium]